MSKYLTQVSRHSEAHNVGAKNVEPNARLDDLMRGTPGSTPTLETVPMTPPPKVPRKDSTHLYEYPVYLSRNIHYFARCIGRQCRRTADCIYVLPQIRRYHVHHRISSVGVS